jgi:hypothetical protein
MVAASIVRFGSVADVRDTPRVFAIRQHGILPRSSATSQKQSLVLRLSDDSIALDEYIKCWKNRKASLPS